MVNEGRVRKDRQKYSKLIGALYHHALQAPFFMDEVLVPTSMGDSEKLVETETNVQRSLSRCFPLCKSGYTPASVLGDD